MLGNQPALQPARPAKKEPRNPRIHGFGGQRMTLPRVEHAVAAVTRDLNGWMEYSELSHGDPEWLR